MAVTVMTAEFGTIQYIITDPQTQCLRVCDIILLWKNILKLVCVVLWADTKMN